MPYYAQIAAGRVVAVTETAGPINVPSMVPLASFDAHLIGYSHADGAFTAPVVTQPRHITAYAFKSRMTAAERIGIRTAAASSPAVYDFLDLADSARYIDLDLAATRAGVQSLEAAGLLAAGRAAAILDGAIADNESVPA